MELPRSFPSNDQRQQGENSPLSLSLYTIPILRMALGDPCPTASALLTAPHYAQALHEVRGTASIHRCAWRWEQGVPYTDADYQEAVIAEIQATRQAPSHFDLFLSEVVANHANYDTKLAPLMALDAQLQELSPSLLPIGPRPVTVQTFPPPPPLTTDSAIAEVCVVAFSGFIRVRDKIEAAAVIKTFREQYPVNTFPDLTVEEHSLNLKTGPGVVPQCTFLVPAQTGRLTDDTPLIGYTDVWSSWPTFIFTVGGISIGVSAFAAGYLIPHRYPTVLSTVTILGEIVCTTSFFAMIWSLSLGRLRLIFRTFDAIYLTGNVMLLMFLLCYTQHYALSKSASQSFSASQVVAAAIFLVALFPLILNFIALDATRDKNLYRRILLYSTSFFFCFSFFVTFRFWRSIFSQEVQNVLKETVEIGIFQAELGVLMAWPATNLYCFSIKYIVSTLRGRELAMLHCPWKSSDLKMASSEVSGQPHVEIRNGIRPQPQDQFQLGGTDHGPALQVLNGSDDERSAGVYFSFP